MCLPSVDKGAQIKLNGCVIFLRICSYSVHVGRFGLSIVMRVLNFMGGRGAVNNSRESSGMFAMIFDVFGLGVFLQISTRNCLYSV